MNEECMKALISGNTLNIKVHPSAKKTKVKEKMADGTWKIDIAAQPEDGKANEELVRYFKDEYDVNVEIIAGAMSKKKIIRVSSL